MACYWPIKTYQVNLRKKCGTRFLLKDYPSAAFAALCLLEFIGVIVAQYLVKRSYDTLTLAVLSILSVRHSV
jgi:hypothetical protein